MSGSSIDKDPTKTVVPGGDTEPGGTWTDDERPQSTVPSAPARQRTPAARRYTEGSTLGQGALGTVRTLHDERLGRDVARKEVRVRGEAQQRRFLREVRITAQLQHPNIVPLYDVGELEDGTPWYTMRLLPGRDLQKALDEASTAEARLELMDHFANAAQAMAYAHDRGVVHRDLKPENIVVGGFGETWVVDWGLAIVLPGGKIDPGDDEPPRPGQIAGTPAYMAPEQARGEPPTLRSDVYGLGAVLYSILAHRPPVQAPTPSEVLKAVIDRGAPPVRTAAPSAPAELAAIADKAMSRDPAQRYPHAGALLDDLRAWQTGRRVQAHSYTAIEAGRLLVQQYRPYLRIGAAVLASFAIATVVGWWQVTRERDAAVMAEHQRSLGLGAALADRARAYASDGDVMRAEAFAAAALQWIPDDPIARGVLARSAFDWRPVLEGSLPVPGGCRALDMSDDGRFLGCAGPDGVRMWEGDRLLWTQPGAGVDIAFDGETLRVADGHSLRTLAVADGHELDRLVAEVRKVDANHGQVAWVERRQVFIGGRAMQPSCRSVLGDLSWSRSGNWLAVACMDGWLYTVDPANPAGVEVSRDVPADPRATAPALAFASEVRTDVAVYSIYANDDGSIFAPSRAGISRYGLDGGRTDLYRGDDGFISAFDQTADDRWLVASTDHGRVLVYEAAGTRSAQLSGLGLPSASFALSPDSQRLYTGGGVEEVRVWRLGDDAPSVRSTGWGLRSLDISPDQVLTTDGLGRTRLWDKHSLQFIYELSAPLHDMRENIPVPLFGRMADGRFAVVGLYGELIVHREGPDARAQVGMIGAEAVTDAMVIDGDTIVGFLATSHRAFAWRAAGEPLMFDVPEAADRFFRGPGRSILLRDGQSVVQIDIDHPENQHRFDRDHEFANVAMSGDYLALSASGPVITIQNVATGEQFELSGHESRVSNLAWVSPTRLASASWDNSIRIWDIPERRLVAVLEGHTSRVSTIVPDGDVLWSIGWDGDIRRWDLTALDADPQAIRDAVKARTGLVVDQDANVRFEQ